MVHISCCAVCSSGRIDTGLCWLVHGVVLAVRVRVQVQYEVSLCQCVIPPFCPVSLCLPYSVY